MREGRKEEADQNKVQSRILAERTKSVEVRLDEIEKELGELLVSVPNLPHDSVPVGKDEASNREVRKKGTPRDFTAEGFEPKDHVDLGTSLGILDLERAAKIAGARFAVLSGMGARLERAIISFMLDLHTREHGYREMLPPFIANAQSLLGTGQLPKFGADLKIDDKNREFYLVPTAEVPLTNLHRDEILSDKERH
jgi:seryl-tRNA synthetase